MKSLKTVFSDKRWLLLAAIVVFALLASWCESRMRRGEQPSVARENNRDNGERGDRRGGRRQPPRQLPEEFEGTINAVEQLKPEPMPPAPVRLERVRTGGHEEFDRVVFDFGGEMPPGFKVEYVDKLTRKCGSDELKVLGGTWLLVRITPAQARNEQGRTTMGGIDFDEDLKVVKLIRQVCDADGQLEWMIELPDRKPYRAEALPDPARLVIDIKHQ
jgi:hypothetical protein